MRIFATGINGFIGSHFLEYAMTRTDHHITGVDLVDSNVASFESIGRFDFMRGDIFADDALLEREVERADVVLPLAGVARPAFYIEHPLRTFELDFEMNLKVVRMCARHDRRVIFPSTSEVYGMCGDGTLDEDSSPLVTGPIRETRWIYSASKQLMDRVIYAMGQERGLRFTLFRPFNWSGPRLDSFADAERRQARVMTQMIYDIKTRGELTVVGSGEQRRSFTWIGDGIEGLARIVADEGRRTNGEILNIGCPSNNISIRELAERIVAEMRRHPKAFPTAATARINMKSAESYYGPSYADTSNRVPGVGKMERLLDWRPSVGMDEIVRLTVEHYAARAEA